MGYYSLRITALMLQNAYILSLCIHHVGIRCSSMSTEVLSVRVRRELKEEAERLGIDIRSVVERALEEEIRRVRKLRFKSLLEEMLKSVDITAEEWVEAVRESRLER